MRINDPETVAELRAFIEIPKSHAIAVAFGLIPLLASWAVGLVDLVLREGGSSFLQSAPSFGDELPIYGLIPLSQGALLASMVWSFLPTSRRKVCRERTFSQRQSEFNTEGTEKSHRGHGESRVIEGGSRTDRNGLIHRCFLCALYVALFEI
jgi:hypothetical protein